jgi:hypothetical protein
MKRMDRKRFLTAVARGGVLAVIGGCGVVLCSREQKFQCSGRCGRCPKFEGGKCRLGIK